MGLIEIMKNANNEGKKRKAIGACPFRMMAGGTLSTDCILESCALWNPISESCSLSYKSHLKTIE